MRMKIKGRMKQSTCPFLLLQETMISARDKTTTAVIPTHITNSQDPSTTNTHTTKDPGETEVSWIAGSLFREILIILQTAVFVAPTVILLQIICERRAEIQARLSWPKCLPVVDAVVLPASPAVYRQTERALMFPELSAEGGGRFLVLVLSRVLAGVTVSVCVCHRYKCGVFAVEAYSALKPCCHASVPVLVFVDVLDNPGHHPRVCEVCNGIC
ncbi:hypothetical protein QQF64_026156 [Cirrhinus molitorella]|uniref:Uncharacterized protein n=1 Tax=Cirrhinus molitorella TaxID=172907 RepID=A0ABR3NR33_9TELE